MAKDKLCVSEINIETYFWVCLHIYTRSRQMWQVVIVHQLVVTSYWN